MDFKYDIIGKAKSTVKLNGPLLLWSALNVLSFTTQNNAWQEVKRLSIAFKNKTSPFNFSIDNTNLTKMATFIALNKQYNTNFQSIVGFIS